jgi:hypothetical protein
MSSLPPRAVVVRRDTEYELLLARHATRGQAEFFLRSRGQSIGEVEADHLVVHAALRAVLGGIPGDWRRAMVLRGELDRFLFEPQDVVIAVGQDGLVANIAKYLCGQPVLGVNPLPGRFDGVLARFEPDDAVGLLHRVSQGGTPEVEARTMVRACLDDSQAVVAMNEVFIGHRSHQSARYRIRFEKREERQSSSGVIVATGTGATGWARSISMSRGVTTLLPGPADPRLAFFVREAFPSVSTGTAITAGLFGGSRTLELVSEMNSGGVVFGDGIEEDFLAFEFGQRLSVGLADSVLNLIVG